MINKYNNHTILYYVCISHNRICPVAVLDFTKRIVAACKVRAFALSRFCKSRRSALTFRDARSSRIILTPSQIANTYLRDPPGRISEQVPRVMTRAREINVKIVHEIPDTRDPRDSSLHGRRLHISRFYPLLLPPRAS